jgi:DNA polymerase III delta prime subunit
MQKKLPLINIVIAALLALLSLLGGFLGSVASNNLNNFPIKLPPAIMSLLQSVWPWLFAVALVYMGLSIWLAVRQSTNGDNALLPGSQRQQGLIEQQNRRRMLEKVQAFWIKGVLEQSLHGAALIALGLHEQPDAVANPWSLVIQQPDQSARPLPPGTRITQVYDDGGGELLILGEPGSGKTTLLLELARDLLDRAQKDDTHLMPVVLNLSSWAVKRQSITDWIVNELNTKYQVPRKLGQLWVDSDQILLLLDGLDEVASEHRSACVDAINAYRQEHGLVPTVVCSRSIEYLTQTRRMLLRNAVTVQLLTAQQIDDYLASAGGQMAAVRVALRNDSVLQELAATPLMLSVLTLAYHGQSDEDILTSGPPEARRRQVFKTYVERMLQRRASETHYTAQQTVEWLTWLAKQMEQRSQTELYLERMQPDWLPDARSRFVYHVAIGLLVGLVLGLVAGLVGTLFGGLFGDHAIGPLIGLLTGLIAGLIFGLEKEIKPAEVITWSWWSVLSVFFMGFVLGLLAGLAIGLAIWLFEGLSVGLIFGLVVGLFMGLFAGIPVGLLAGLSGQTIDQQSLVTPNQGIWRSARNGALLGLVFGLPIGLVFGLFVGLFEGPVAGLVGGLGGAVIDGPFFGLFFGGLAFIQHFALRWFLWRAEYVPWNYPRFLDYTADRILLRKVGGGYIFVHRLLQDYFASLDITTKSSGVAEQT